MVIFEDCIVCAVNHNGDSDSTGAIAGNIIGAIFGYSSIPGHYIENLEIEPVLVSYPSKNISKVSISQNKTVSLQHKSLKNNSNGHTMQYHYKER